MNHVGVKLREGDEREGSCPKSGFEEAAIFENFFARVPLGEAKVQDPGAVQEAFATDTRAEAVDQPGEFTESANLENAKSTRDALGPVGHRRKGVFTFTADASSYVHTVGSLSGWRFDSGHNISIVAVRAQIRICQLLRFLN